MIYAAATHPVRVGNLVIGGSHPVVIQSMTNTDTLDTAATVAQCQRLFDAGCQMVRITAPGLKEARNLEDIKNQLHQKGYTGPLVADIHFLPEAALMAASIVEKIRINPGNYCDRNRGKTEFSPAEQAAERERIAERLSPLVEVCRQHGTAIRVGVNQGSLSERLVSLYGNTPRAMVESALEFIGIFEKLRFDQLVISMKSSRVQLMNQATRMLWDRMRQNGKIFPLHIGVTEAGDGEDARIISAIGIGSLLTDGIGHTIRVSLTEAPENEVPVAQSIVKAAEYLQSMPETERDGLAIRYDAQGKILADAKDGTVQDGTSREANIVKDKEFARILTAVRWGRLMLQGQKEGFRIEGDLFSEEEKTRLIDDIFHAAGLRSHKTRFIACPSCGRTKYDIQSVLAQVKARFPNYPNLTLAVMGCIVNGPGEMADADYGYIGCGNGQVNLYRKGKLVKSHIPEDKALDELEALLSLGEGL